MGSKGGLALALLALGCASVEEQPVGELAPAQTTRAGDRDEQANVATLLWIRGCLEHLGDYAAQSSWARRRGLRATTESFSSAVLKDAEGEVWAASDPTGDYVLVLTRPHQCAVWARRANAVIVNANFERIINGMEHERLVLERRHDRMIDGAGGIYRQIVYFAEGEGNPSGFLFLSTTTRSEDAEFQARLTAARATK